MAPSRQEDFDWLYGGQNPPDRQPEPTRVLPSDVFRDRPDEGSRGPVSGQAEPTRHPYPEQAYPDQAYPDQAYPDQRYPDQAYPGQAGPSSGPPPAGSAVPPWTASPGPGGPRGPDGPGGSAPGGRGRRPRRRHPLRTAVRVLVSLLLVAVLALIGIPAYAWSQVGRTAYAPDGDRPSQQPGTTFLLVGSDSREGLTAAQRKRLGTGSTAGQRTDTIMLLHIPRSGRPALISLPRDSYLPIPGHGSNKINASYAFGGPELLVETIEGSTGLRVDAYMEIGFGGFVGIIDSLGGIEMCLPKAIKDADSHLNLKKGCQILSGTNALGYVRMRKADPLGDLGRVQRQRQMLAAVAGKAASPATVLNPWRYWQVSTATAEALTLGEDTSLLQTARLGLAMKAISGGDGLTLTVPVANSGASTPVGSAVLWDDDRAAAMFADLARGDTSDLDKYAE